MLLSSDLLMDRLMRANLKDHKMSNTIMALRTERWSYIIALLAVAALIVLVVTNTFFSLFGVARQAVASQKEISSIINLHNTIKPDLKNLKKPTLSSLALFGTAPSGIETATNTNFTLLGIQYSASHPDLGKAIINTGSNDGIYSIGDKLTNNVTVDSITADSVIILQNGVKKKLTMTWEGESLISHTFEPVNLASDSTSPSTTISNPRPTLPTITPSQSAYPPNFKDMREKYLQLQKQMLDKQ